MDHAINSLRPYYEVELDLLAEELQSGKYAKLSDCPSYKSARALLDAIHVLQRYMHGKSTSMSIRDEMKWRGLL